MSPLALHADEIRPARPGAPRAQSVDVLIPSLAAAPAAGYRIIREPSGAWIHHPSCSGFAVHGVCRHVERARALTERPLRALADDLAAIAAAAPPPIARGGIEDERALVAWTSRLAERIAAAHRAFDAREAWLVAEARRAAMTPAERSEDAFRRMTL